MDELSFDGKTYVSSKQAAKISGYAKDYIGQLCREGRIEARLVGRNWYVSEEALSSHRFGEGKSRDKVKVVDSEERRPIAAPEAVSPVWEKSRYILYSGSEIPQLSYRIPVNALRTEVAQDSHAHLITEMQDAWQEWFTRKEGESKAEEDKATDEVLEDSLEEEEAAVPMELGVVETSLDVRHADELETIGEPETEIESEDAEAEVQTVPIVRITETKVTRREDRKPLPQVGKEGLSPLAVLGYRTALIGVSALFALLALIGTGLLTHVGGTLVTEIPVLRNVAGIAAIEASK
ncbi:MAG: helix-turn-helix domain-containing protein [Candidatus Pacebacteria bacterium]|nr:helix-turn-helix domain-containing protein [Candidatus Paceibacterota bacterium]MBP9840707.1 helix-turn-helix domain-containing protein [Candidatus Paceibacterota bacterium]